MDNSRAWRRRLSARWSAAWPVICFSPTTAGGCADRLEPALEDFARELNSFRSTVQKAAGVANEGWKLLNEAMGDSGQAAQSRYPSARQTSPF